MITNFGDNENSKREPSAAINPDMLYYSYCTGNGTLDFNIDQVPNCYSLDEQITNYLNTPATQEAIHARVCYFLSFLRHLLFSNYVTYLLNSHL